MWRATAVVLQSLLTVCLCALSYGPCHDVTTVDLDTSKWPGTFFINVMTKNEGARCLWVEKSLQYADGNSSNTTAENVIIAETFRRIVNGTAVESNVIATYVGKGHYQIKSTVADKPVVFEAKWLHFDSPDLDCHFVCSDNELLKNGHGALFCESASPDALKKNAHKIKEIVTMNNFDINDLMVVDNCNCSNIPFAYKSSCETPSIEDYFSDS